MQAFSMSFQPPPDIAPGHNLYLRTDHSAAYVRAQGEFLEGDGDGRDPSDGIGPVEP